MFWGWEIYGYIFYGSTTAKEITAGYAITGVLVAIGALSLVIGQVRAWRSGNYEGPCGLCKQITPMKGDDSVEQQGNKMVNS